MAATQFFLPYRIAAKPTNVGAPGAKMYVYAPGTTTLRAVYASNALTTQLSNPVVADGAGKFPDVWLSNALTYKLVFKDKSGATLDTFDPYIPGQAPDATALQPLQSACEAAAAAASADADAAAASAASALASAAISLDGGDADGYFYDTDYGTRFKLAIVDGALAPAIAPHIIIDPFNGNDAHDGLTRATALRTSVGLINHALMGAAGADANNPAIVRGLTIGIVGHATQVIRDTFDFYLQNAGNGFRQMHGCTFVAVGDAPVHFDCTDVATTFAAHGSIANAWTKSWTHAISGGSGSRVRVYSNGQPLKRVQNESDVAAGKYWTNGNPVAGSPLGITFIDFGSGNPNSNGHVITITARDVAISMRSGRVMGIWAERNGHNNGSIYLFDGQSAGGVVGDIKSEIRSCLLYEGTKHHLVIGNGRVVGSAFVNSMDNEYYHDGSFPAYAAFFETDMTGKTVAAENSHFMADTSLWGGSVGVGQNDASAFLAHDANAGSGPAVCTITNCSNIGLTGGFSFGLITTTYVTGHYSPAMPTTPGVHTVLDGDTRVLSVARSFIGGAERWASGVNLTVRSCLLLSDRAFSGGGLTTLNRNGSIVAENNIVSASPNQAAFFIEMNGSGAAAETLTINRNVVANFGNVFGVAIFVAAPTVAPTITSDYQVFKGDGGFNGYNYVKNVNRTLATWQGTSGSPDANSLSAADASAAGFVSGLFPSATNLDVRLTAAGAANARLTDPITQAEIDAMLARPKTYAEAQLWWAAKPDALPVITL